MRFLSPGHPPPRGAVAQGFPAPFVAPMAATTDFMLPVVMPTRDRKIVFRPNDQGSEIKSGFGKLAAHVRDVQRPVPNVGPSVARTRVAREGVRIIALSNVE
jgi:hypothetical protein